MSTANDLLMGASGPPSFFNANSKVGETCKGIVTGIGEMQARDFVTQQPKVYADGNPIMQVVITVQLDDGEERRLFCKPAMKAAVRDAVLAAGAEGLDIGGRLAVQYSGDEAPEKAGLSGKKLYVAQYEAPSKAVSADDLL